MPDGSLKTLYISSYDHRKPQVPVGFTYLGLPDRVFGNEMKPSINTTILQQIKEVNVEDGVSEAEATVLAQHAMVEAGRSVSHNLAVPLVMDINGIHIIGFRKRGDEESTLGADFAEFLGGGGMIYMVSPEGTVSEWRLDD